MSSSDLPAALEEERQQIFKMIQNSNRNAATIALACQSAINEKHAVFHETSRKYSRWVDRQARKMNARLEKKRKQLERNMKKMAFRRDVLQAETESLKAEIAKTEADRLILQARAKSRLEEIEREKMAEVAANTRLTRSRAPSPEPYGSSARANIINRATQNLSSRAERLDTSCRAKRLPTSGQRFSYHHPNSLPKSMEHVESKAPHRKIIWKVTYKADSPLPALSTSAIQPPLPIPTDEECKNNRKAKNTMKTYALEKYTWEEYDHSEIFEEPDNPNDEDYDPGMED